MSIISTRQLSRRYGQRVGVDGVDLQIDAGQIFGYLGPNGAGKSTTIRLLLGFLKPSSGAASIDGRDCWRDSKHIKREVGYLPGDLRLYPSLTGQSALDMVGRIRGADLRPRGNELAERFQLEMDIAVRKMSRGTRQKLGLVLTLAHDPRVLILDEPTSGLDPLMQNELARCLRERARDGSAVLLSSHTLSEVESLCDRMAIVRRGKIVANETLDSLRSRARRTVVIQFADDGADGQLPPGLRLVSREGSRGVYQLDGPTPDLIHWADRQAVEDISISPPDLESLFHQYYQETPEA